MDNKLDIALKLSEEILAGIEMETIKPSSAALQCLRIARLVSDATSFKWLQYEVSGYPKGPSGHIDSAAFNLGFSKGRGYYSEDGKSKYIFTELVSELENLIETSRLAIGSLTTQGVSIGGEYAAMAMQNLSNKVIEQSKNNRNNININQRRLAILKGKYYEYAMTVNMELKFSKQVEEIFHSFRTSVDSQLMKLAPKSLNMLEAAYERLTSENPESWSQALTSCRRVFQEISDSLFQNIFPNYTESSYETKTGKKLNISGDSYLNRLYAVVDKIDEKAANNTLIGSHILYAIDWIENLHSQLCKGVHTDMTFEEARRSVLHTYICLGDIAKLVCKI